MVSTRTRKFTLYRYRSFSNLNRELDAIEKAYLSCAAYKKMNDPMEGLYAATRRLQHSESFENIQQEILLNKRSIGVCSFSEGHNHELMWAHYSSQFKGICVAYDLYKLLRALPEEVSFARMFYNEDVPNVGLSHTPFDEQAKMVLSYKNHRWLYEREWRMFATSQGQVSYHDPDCVTAIYVGARIPPNALRRIEKRLKPLNILVSAMQLDGYTMSFDETSP